MPVLWRNTGLFLIKDSFFDRENTVGKKRVHVYERMERIV